MRIENLAMPVLFLTLTYLLLNLQAKYQQDLVDLSPICAVFVAFFWLCNSLLHSRLVISYQTDGDAVEKQLVKAAFRMANRFASHPMVRVFLESSGVSAKILLRKNIKVLFQDPQIYFGKGKKNYAYSWIDPGNFDLYTVIIDSSILTRYRTLSATGVSVATEEMELIEFFVAIKLLHELAHLGFRWTHSDYLVNESTTPHINEGDSGNVLEKRAFGGVAGFTYAGKAGWDGSQEFRGILIGGALVRDDYIRSVSAECRRYVPDVSKLLPIDCDTEKFRCERNEHIKPPPPACREASYHDAVEYRMMPWGSGGARQAGSQPPLRPGLSLLNESESPRVSSSASPVSESPRARVCCPMSVAVRVIAGRNPRPSHG